MLNALRTVVNGRKTEKRWKKLEMKIVVTKNGEIELKRKKKQLQTICFLFDVNYQLLNVNYCRRTNKNTTKSVVLAAIQWQKQPFDRNDLSGSGVWYMFVGWFSNYFRVYQSAPKERKTEKWAKCFFWKWLWFSWSYVVQLKIGR